MTFNLPNSPKFSPATILRYTVINEVRSVLRTLPAFSSGAEIERHLKDVTPMNLISSSITPFEQHCLGVSSEEL